MACTFDDDCWPGDTTRRPLLHGSPLHPVEEETISPAPSLMIRSISIGSSDTLLADAVMIVLSPSSSWPWVDLSVTNNVSHSDSGLVHRGCSHELLLWGVAVLGTDPKGSRVLVEDAGVVAVGAEVSVASGTDPQAITASMIARQDVRKIL